MIEPIKWNDENPFSSSKPLRITFHTSSLKELPDEEAEALDTLEELCAFPYIQAFQTEPGKFTHIQIDSFNAHINRFPIRIDYQDGGWLKTSIYFPNYLSIRQMTESNLLDDIIAAKAHFTLQNHIFVTNSPRLLENKSVNYNLRTPSEAAKIVGLFLRAKNIYAYGTDRVIPNVHFRGSDHFYWVLARHLLPSMWQYFSMCINAEKVRGDNSLYLAQSILKRAARILRARDIIGTQFFKTQGNDTSDTTNYHFDYLLLLFSGIFDAQSLIGYYAYNITKPKEKLVSFRNDEYKIALKNNSNAQQLYQIISDSDFINLMTLLNELRNTIHSTGLPTTGVVNVPGESYSFMRVFPKYEKQLWEAANRLGSSDSWGLTKNMVGFAMLEPYTYSNELIRVGFRLINQIADATDLTGLFPLGYPIPQIDNKPPNEEIWGEFMRKRLSILF